jgi:hypothetical protein
MRKELQLICLKSCCLLLTLRIILTPLTVTSVLGFQWRHTANVNKNYLGGGGSSLMGVEEWNRTCLCQNPTDVVVPWEYKLCTCEFLSFRSDVVELSVLLAYCTASLGNWCPTFRGVQSPRKRLPTSSDMAQYSRKNGELKLCTYRHWTLFWNRYATWRT